MALKPCPECGNSVSTRADSCPKCGFPLNSQQMKPIKEEGSGLTFWGVVGAIILAVIILSIF